MQLTPVVLALIIANVVCYGLEVLIGFPVIQHFALWAWGSYSEDGITVGFQPWQLITYGFLHSPSSIAHIVFNMYALYAFGGAIERALGSTRFAWLYFASVLTAGLAQLIVATMSVQSSGNWAPTLGASGGVFGVLLAFGMLFPKQRVMLMIPPIPMPAWVLVTLYGLVELASGFFGWQRGVAHFAHIGGMVGAFISLLVFHYQSYRRN